jgi:hypothetical protein
MPQVLLAGRRYQHRSKTNCDFCTLFAPGAVPVTCINLCLLSQHELVAEVASPFPAMALLLPSLKGAACTSVTKLLLPSLS